MNVLFSTVIIEKGVKIIKNYGQQNSNLNLIERAIYVMVKSVLNTKSDSFELKDHRVVIVIVSSSNLRSESLIVVIKFELQVVPKISLHIFNFYQTIISTYFN